MNFNQTIMGDTLTVLKTLPDELVDCVVTSPPYWGLRDYGMEGQIGLEKTPEEYVAKMVEIFGELKRVLKKEGTCWLNLGDSYNGSGHNTLKPKDLVGIPWRVAFALQADGWWLRQDIIWAKPNPMPESVTDRCTKAHEYIFLLTKSARYYFDNEAIKEQSIDLESFSGRRLRNAGKMDSVDSANYKFHGSVGDDEKLKSGQKYETRNKRSVWTVNTKPYAEAHFATFPEALIEPMIKAGCPEFVCKLCGKAREKVGKVIGKKITESMKIAGCNNNGEYFGVEQKDYDSANAQKPSETKKRILESMSQVKEFSYIDCGCNAGWSPGIVLDPFMGSGTTGRVATKLNRNWLGIELNPAYGKLIEKRTDKVQRNLL